MALDIDISLLAEGHREIGRNGPDNDISAFGPGRIDHGPSMGREITKDDPAIGLHDYRKMFLIPDEAFDIDHLRFRSFHFREPLEIPSALPG